MNWVAPTHARHRVRAHGGAPHLLDWNPMLPTDLRPPSRRARLVAALVLGSLALSSLAGVAAADHRQRPDVPSLEWQQCGDGLQCARASVPLDHDHPRGRHIALSLAKLPATDPAHRIGTLFVNNGGPGNSVIEFMHVDVRDVVPAAVQ